MKQRPSSQKTIKTEAMFRAAFAERLKRVTQNHDIGELASKLGVTAATLYRWLNGKFDPSLPKLAELAQAMNVSLAWLVTGAGPIDSRRALRQALLEGYDTTEFISAGRRPSKPPIAFNEAWLFALLFGAPDEPTGPGDLSSPLLIEMNDDSMEPTIGKGDLVLVDRSFGLRPFELQQALREKRSIHDGIYAFKAGLLSRRANDSNDQFIVRRVQYRLDGMLAVRCDNPSYPEELYTQRKSSAPIGRVVWRAMRL